MRFVLTAAAALVAAVPAQAATTFTFAAPASITRVLVGSADYGPTGLGGSVTFGQINDPFYTGVLRLNRFTDKWDIGLASHHWVSTDGEITLDRGRITDVSIFAYDDPSPTFWMGGKTWGFNATNWQGTRVTESYGGVDYIPGVPEPATWAMMIAGFGMVGGLMRRRKSQTSIVYG